MGRSPVAGPQAQGGAGQDFRKRRFRVFHDDEQELQTVQLAAKRSFVVGVRI